MPQAAVMPHAAAMVEEEDCLISLANHVGKCPYCFLPHAAASTGAGAISMSSVLNIP